METCTLPYIKQMNNVNSMHEIGDPKLVFWDNPEGQGREGGGRGDQDEGDTCKPVANSC